MHIITKYGMPVAYATQNIPWYDVQHKVYSWCRCVCVCVCLRVCYRLSCTTSARRCVCARARAVVREFADGAGAVRRVPRLPTKKFVHGMPASTLGADR